MIFRLQSDSYALGIVTVGPKKQEPAKLALLCHYSLVKLGEIEGNQVRSKTVQVIGQQEDLLYFLALVEATESV